jgi:N-acyl-D-amino-acid deacylase
VVVGQDGSSPFPLERYFGQVRASGGHMNVASFAGHGTLRWAAMDDDYERPARPDEIDHMRRLVAREMDSGALGLCTGLEYRPGLFAQTDEIVELAREAARRGGLYISHIRNEDDRAFEALNEVMEIGRRARIPVQVSHLKLGSRKVWGRTGEVLGLFQTARRQGVSVTADVYPYLYWSSYLTVLRSPDGRDERGAWETGLDAVGGAENVRITSFSAEPAW